LGVRVAAVQLDVVWEDKPANHAAVEGAIERAHIEPGTFVLLPELGDTGFSFDLDAIADGATLPWAAGLARRRGIWLQCGFAERGHDGKGRNCAAIVAPSGDVAAVYRKVHPFTYGREGEHYGAGDRLCIVQAGGAVVCPLICYDLRFPELWRLAAAAGAELYAIGASWPDARQAHWRSLLVARAIENQAFVVGANRIGSDPDFTYDGGSMIVSPHGDILAEAGRTPAVLTAELDLPALQRWRKEFPALRDLRRQLLGTIEVTAAMMDTAAGRHSPGGTLAAPG
jgi:predicted amidohydrolase